jgi:uncharacterized membrane protein
MHLIVVGFEKPEFRGEILDELTKVREKGIIRLIDALMVHKDQSGDLLAVEMTDFSLGERMEVGAIIGGLFGLGATGTVEGAEAGADLGIDLALAQNDYGIAAAEIEEIGEAIPRGGAALIMLFEHTWAIGLREAIFNTGGVPLAQGLLDPATLITMGALVAAAAEELE